MEPTIRSREPEETSGRASIREVYKIVRDLEGTWGRMLSETEKRIGDKIDDLGERVGGLEAWRGEWETERFAAKTKREGMVGPWRTVVYWSEAHWRVIVAVSFVAIAMIALLLDTRIDVHPQ